MKISPEQIEAIARTGGKVTPESAKVDAAVIRLVDNDLIKMTAETIKNMPDREDMIAELKARIQNGTYNPTGDEIAEAMIRRSTADKIE